MKWTIEKEKMGLGRDFHSFLLDGGISKSLQSIVRGGVNADGIIGHALREGLIYAYIINS